MTELALEGFGYAETIDGRIANLRRDLADDVLLDDIGRACVARCVARQMFTDRAQKVLDTESRRAAELAEAKSKPHPIRARVRALQQRESVGDPLADMKQDEFESGWERAAQVRDEMASGKLVYRNMREEQDR